MAKTERRECDVRGCNNIAIWCTDHMIEIENNVRKETVEAILNIISDMITDVEEAGFDNPEDQKYIDALEAVTTEIKKKFLGSL